MQDFMPLFVSSFRSPKNACRHDLLADTLKYFVCFEGFITGSRDPPQCWRKLSFYFCLQKTVCYSSRVPQACSLWGRGVGTWLGPAKENLSVEV
jgi:hypothetical protein